MSEEYATPEVLIVGAGLGGIMLGILLEQIGIPYRIFERATKLKPLGSVMTLGPTILPIFEQLGLLDDIIKISLPCKSLDMYNPQLNKIGSIDLSPHKDTGGYENYLFARPRLYELMLNHIPPEKLTMGKKILRIEEKDSRVVIHCADGTRCEGDILVGADGAYSGVRQSLYKTMNEKGILPKSDLENLSIGFVSMVGVSTPPNPEKFPQMSDGIAHYSNVLGKDTRSWGVFAVPDNQVCFVIAQQLSQAEAQEQQFRNSEWGPEANDAMLKEFYDMPCPWGGKMGEFFDATPKELISKVYLEEKLFKTWYHGRTVLIGDGAVNAMQDAVVLANCLYSMKDSSQGSITGAYKEYYKQRFERSEVQFERSSAMSKTISGQTWSARLIRSVLLNYLPKSALQVSFNKTFEYKPQIAWLPLAEAPSKVRAIPQEGERKPLSEERKVKAFITSQMQIRDYIDEAQAVAI
ncbi:hypothetical protein BGZ98_004085 [Dissophora globulifera]|nr:hypothetical protein BGZ98_004085 [Dissophora globulifera]